MSGLRYPGGKTRAVKHIIPYFPKNRKYASPFLGGGSIELALTKYGKVYGYDIFQPLVYYWQQLIKNPEKLANLIQKYHPITKQEFLKYRQDIKQFLNSQANDEVKTDSLSEIIGAKYFVLNRCSFSGTTMSGGFSSQAGEKRFTKSSIERVYNFKNKRIQVTCMDFAKSIARHPNDVLYLDPPYYTAKKLYGDNGELQTIDHEKLFRILSQRDDWILSYDNCEYIRNLYKDYIQIIPKWSYGMSKDKKSKELLILSPSIARYNNLDCSSDSN